MKETAEAAESAPTRATTLLGPVIEADEVRIAVGESVMMVGLSLVTRGDRVLLVGSAEVLVEAIVGAPRGNGRANLEPIARVVGGSLSVGGAPVDEGAHYALCGMAPRDAPLPPRWTVQEYLSWGGRLGGEGRRQAKTLALAALERLGLGGHGGRRLKTLSLHERRIMAIGLSIIHDPPLVVMDDPLTGLDERRVTDVMAVMALAAEGRAVVLSVPGLTAGSPAAHLAQTATDICVFRGGELVLVAEPSTIFASATIYELRVKRGAEALRSSLADRGIELHGGPEHFSLSLPVNQGPSEVLAAAAEAQAAVISCVPLL